MRFFILVFIIFCSSIVAIYGQGLPHNILSNEENLIGDEYVKEVIPILPAIDHQQFDYAYIDEFKIQSSFSQSKDKLKNVASDNPSLEIKQQYDRYRPETGFSIGIRYLGILTNVGVEKSFYKNMSVGLYYGQFVGRYYGVNKKGIIPRLDHYSLEFNLYMNSRKEAFASGALMKFGVHYNHLKSGGDAKQVEVQGQKVIGPGETKWGPLIGGAYFWQGPYVNFCVGVEYFVVGKLKSFVPLSLGLGIAF